MKYPIYIPEITATEKEYVSDCLESTWISSKGKYISQFEEKVATFSGVKHAIAVHNGTVALHLSLLVNGIGNGDEVIVPDFTYIASANAILYVGAKPILADVDPDTWNITASTIKKLISPKTRAIIVTDVYGLTPDMNEINKLAKENDLIVIEDAAESIGASYKGRRAGSLADISIFSFFGNKTISTGEGGMVLTNNDTIASLLRKLKNQGNSNTIRYYHDVLGYNYRMTNIQAAIGLAQMERINHILERKANINEYYRNHLKSYARFQRVDDGYISSNWMVGFLVEDIKQRDELMASLEADGIETRPFFNPVHTMPFYDEYNNPVSVELSHRGISVPSYPMLNKEDIDYISSRIINFLK
ncbi:MAG: DegT/DnrJ/EryC1/StrS family aminotransferase [Bacteroidota bacterium]